MVDKPITFDWKHHLREWLHIALPIFVIIVAVALIGFLVFRPDLNDGPEFLEPGRIGLLDPSADPLFDPAFAVATPIELVRAPTATSFDTPCGSRHAALTYNAQPFLTNRHLGDDINGIGGQNSDLGDPVFAIGDGLVIYAGWASEGWGNVVILLHERADGIPFESFYGHLDSIHVPVGQQLRRGEKLGTIGNADGVYLAHLHFELRKYATVDIGAGYAEGKVGRTSGELFLTKWRTEPDDSLFKAVAGEELEPSSLGVDVQNGGTR